MARGKLCVAGACVLWLATFSAACDAFDHGRLMPRGGTGGMGGSGDVDAGEEDAGRCIPAAESCNGLDDDCDGMSDAVDQDADDYCEGIVVHAEAGCVPTSEATAVCVRLMSTCDPGWSSCDGDPSNGCEQPGNVCPCRTCGDDAGMDEDAGL